MQPWMKPLWGSLTQVSSGGGGPAPSGVGMSFIWSTNVVEPNNGTAQHLPGLTGDNDGVGGFYAPVDMTLKAVSDRTSRGASGYRADFEYYIRINSGAEVSLAAYLASEGNVNVYLPDISITAGDFVELLYTGGNNFSSSAALAFYFESDTDDSSGLFYQNWYARFAVGTALRILWLGDSGSSNTYPPAPVDFVVRKGHWVGTIASVDDITFTLVVDGEVRWTGVMTGGDTSEDWDIDIPILRGQTYYIAAQDEADNNVYGGFTMDCEIVGKTLAPNTSLTLLAAGDARLAGDIGTKYYAEVATTIKRVDLSARFGFTGQVNVSVDGGADQEIFDDAVASLGVESATPNLIIPAGSYYTFNHTGTGTTGAGLSIMLTLETASSAAYTSPAYVAPVDQVASGASADYNMNNYAGSTSSYQTKGNIYKVVQDRILTHVRFDSNTTSMTVDVVIALVDDDYLITEIIERVTGYTTTTGYQEIELTTPYFLEAGDNLYVAPIRTDSASLRMDYDRSPVEGDPNNHFIAIGRSQMVGDDNAVTDDVYNEGTTVWDIGLTSEVPGSIGKQRFWSILMEGSDDGTAHALAGLELRPDIGGTSHISAFTELLGSSADTLYDVKHLIDADLATTWEITDADYDASKRRIIFASPTPVGVAEVVLKSTSGADFDKTPTDWKLQFSEDGLLWVDAFTSSGEAAWSASETRVYEALSPPDNGRDDDHRYWAVLGTSNTNGQSYMSVVECEMRESAAGANEATSGQAIDNGNTYSTGNEGDKAFDGSDSTYWQVRFSETRVNQRWFGQDFGSGNEKCIKEITLKARSGSQDLQCITSGLVMWSDDGTNWNPAWSFYDISTWNALETRTFQSPSI